MRSPRPRLRTRARVPTPCACRRASWLDPSWKGTDPVHKVTIVPRGRALGYTWQRPSEERCLLCESELNDRLAVLVGGRVAKALPFSEVSTSAADDLARAADLARRMVTESGISPTLGPVRLASDRALKYPEQTGLTVGREGVRQVLQAAAFTYLAGLAQQFGRFFFFLVLIAMAKGFIWA